MKHAEPRPYSSPSRAAEKLIEIAKTLRVDHCCKPVGEWNDTFLRAGGNVAEYAAGRDHAVAAGIIEMHECGAIFMWKAPQAGDDLIPVID